MSTIVETAIKDAVKMVREAGQLLLQAMDDKKVITKNGTANFVTEIDLKVQEILFGKLLKLLPDSNIIAEETADNIFALDKYTWILDPVDGTTNLMYGYKYSAIALGLVVDGVPYAGIVYNPFLNEMFTAQKGKGAFVNDSRIGVTTNGSLSDSLLGYGTSPYDRGKADETFRITKNVFNKCRDIRRSGSAALDICNVAAGRTDGFFEMELQPWDYAGAAIILEEAGGRITDWQGKNLTYISKSSAIVTNGLIHKELLDAIK
ncbi:inositol monophosphatase family protein [Ruminiclostridium cellulolyticum]|uniref:Inositol-1-monophosphatase n=1 Tax=Ruminiclostridium cellulolyticum (strain ATCC 35319 / DSM 5812 / JCM 6584 / H10) TaxID=394503 RepID=B8I634_RUMCH|nr:inositol monophosphatase family protein [Ruminiclostridium cellulolyticum]ACL76799.1 inositol monophosphatase [Ruminiclostridium cellulolyticum H10]